MQYLFYALLSLKVMLLSNIVPKSLIEFNFSKIYTLFGTCEDSGYDNAVFCFFFVVHAIRK